MKLVTATVRELNEGVDHQEFRRAWTPDETVPGDLHAAFSALNLENPRELCTIALIDDVTAEDIQVWMERLAHPITA